MKAVEKMKLFTLKMAFFLSYSMLFVLAMLNPVFANSLQIPEGVKVLSAPEVRKMVGNNEVLLVHTLSRIEYQVQHIPGSINIPVDEIASSPKMPANKDTGIIFFCNGLACPYSKRASEIAVGLGYRQVYWFRGGILEWRKYLYDMVVDEELIKINIPKLSPDQFRVLAKNDVLILDVRPRWWRESAEKSGVIVGTNMMIPLLDLDRHMDSLPKDRPILLADRLMRQSIHAGKFLKKNGYNIIGVLKGGSRRWISEGLPVLKKEDEPAFDSGI